ncbi:MAG TPA: NAD-dependent epimerase/dehydratase family protein [candidate division WOR-3 bacterium]|uniref:NAD-dependent epimerase/dehydratase family protein n=1 Tax=candidate division WOR-3 bacterium TaxID=2052148 RepID=A0A9C9ELX6_UNCW3|nr:NAD-dependent epimerase/dehydratase family protein [candidate division WOR-3 bacterium]
MKVILVTGSEGFVGSHLVKALKEDLFKIIPTCYPLLASKVESCIPLDILNLEMVKEVVKSYEPDIIFHLAGISSVSKSFRDPPLTYNTNVIGTVNLLEAAKSLKKKMRFIFVSSCEVYGGGKRISEKAEVVLKNPYAISKYAAELICRNSSLDGIEWIILRPFTHTGPGQTKDFVLPTIAFQIAEIEKGRRPPLIELGNIDARREFINIRDVIRAYQLAIEKAKPANIYNISSNKGYTISEALEIFRRISKVKFEVKTDSAKMRKTDIPVLVGNGSKFSKLSGWKPRIKFEKTIEDLLNYWRAKI